MKTGITQMSSESIAAFLDFLRGAGQRFQMATADEREANDETQDILHELELQPHKYHEFASLAKELVPVRNRRRVAKDTQTVYQPVVDWMAANQSVVKSLERLLGDVRKAEKSTQNRMYTPRVRDRQRRREGTGI